MWIHNSLLLAKCVVLLKWKITTSLETASLKFRLCMLLRVPLFRISQVISDHVTTSNGEENEVLHIFSFLALYLKLTLIRNI